MNPESTELTPQNIKEVRIIDSHQERIERILELLEILYSHFPCIRDLEPLYLMNFKNSNVLNKNVIVQHSHYLPEETLYYMSLTQQPVRVDGFRLENNMLPVSMNIFTFDLDFSLKRVKRLNVPSPVERIASLADYHESVHIQFIDPQNGTFKSFWVDFGSHILAENSSISIYEAFDLIDTSIEEREKIVEEKNLVQYLDTHYYLRNIDDDAF